jgi:hypothetical protein
MMQKRYEGYELSAWLFKNALFKIGFFNIIVCFVCEFGTIPVSLCIQPILMNFMVAGNKILKIERIKDRWIKLVFG